MAKILLVDDDTTFCLMLKTWLTKRGFEVENALNKMKNGKAVRPDNIPIEVWKSLGKKGISWFTKLFVD